MAVADDPNRPISLFYSDSQKNERFREKIENQLRVLQRRGVISQWHDRKIGAGREWAKMTRALERHDANEARVIPVILQPCLWRDAPLAKLQAVPKDGKPVTKWQNRADA